MALTALWGCGQGPAQGVPPAQTAAPEAAESLRPPEAAQDAPPPEFIPTQVVPAVDQALEDLLAEEIAAYAGTWRVYCQRLDTGVAAAVGEGPGVAASLIKLFVAGAYLQAVEQGELEDTWQAELERMITQSSNDDCNTLIDVLGQGDAAAGKAAVNQFAAALDCGDTALNRKMLEISDQENYTSPRDCGRLLRAVWEGTFVSAQASETIRAYLEQQTRRNKIPAGLPAGVRCGNKTGELANVENDAAIVWTEDGAYVLCVMVSDTPAPGTTQSQIAHLSQSVYQYLTS